MIVPIPKAKKGRKAPRPKLAATIVLLREHNGNKQILMGKRSTKHDFMPSVYVFPGGRVDRADSFAPSIDEPDKRTQNILQNALSEARARACVLAAIRETFEETGIIIGQKAKTKYQTNHKSWREFHAGGYLPKLSGIELFGRAITPPHRDKRFDTWFFLKHMSREEAYCPFCDSKELLDIGWFDFSQIKNLPTHRATDMMLEQLKIYLADGRQGADIFMSKVIGRKFVFSRFPT